MIVLLIFLVILFAAIPVVYLFWTVRQISRAVENKVFAVVLKPGGQMSFPLCPIEGKFARVPNTGADEVLVGLATDATYNALYPTGMWPPKMFRKTIRAIVVEEGQAEPVHPHRGDPVVDGAVIATLKKQKFMESAMTKSREAAAGGVLGRFGGKLTWVYIFLAVITVLLIITLVFGVMGYSGTQEIQAGFGLK